MYAGSFYGGYVLISNFDSDLPTPYGYCHPETNQILPNEKKCLAHTYSE